MFFPWCEKKILQGNFLLFNSVHYTYSNIIKWMIWLPEMTNFLSVIRFIHRLNPVWVKLLCLWVCKAVLTEAQCPMTHSWRNISWCSRMLLSGVSGLLLEIWHGAVGGQAIRSPHCSEIQECCNPGFGIRRASDLSVGTNMLHACAMENALMLKQSGESSLQVPPSTT